MLLNDVHGIAGDSRMPWIGNMLDPSRVEAEFRNHLPHIVPPESGLTVLSTRVVRYKAGRRCIVEYELEIEAANSAPQRLTLLGKVQARGLDSTSYEVQRTLWRAGFGNESSDGISVPEPIGMIPTFRMWLQRKVPGIHPTELLTRPGGSELARQIAAAAHKLHTAGIGVERRHTMADELRILDERLAKLAETMPHLARQLESVLHASKRLAATVPAPATCGIHRDFYPDQVLVDGERLYLVDFDLLCQGDPGLDIGNFLGHLIEESLRTRGDPEALADRQREMEDHFVALSGAATRTAIHVYTTLTLIRHIQISTLFVERRPFTEALLELCVNHLNQPES